MKESNIGDFYKMSEKKVCLYGYGERAIYLKEKISRKQKVYYIIDRNAERINIENVITLERFSSVSKDNKDDWCIIICMQNALQHKTVAFEVHSKGYDNIIYIDLSDDCSIINNSKMREVYLNLLYSDDFNEILVPNCNSVLLNKNQSDIIRRFNNYIEFWCPLKLVYVDNEKPVSLSEERWKVINKYYDINITKFKPYSDLYDYIIGKIYDKKCLDIYFEIIGKEITEETINDRKNLFETLNKKLKYDPLYFVDTPSPAKWNNKGYFNLTDGHNRSTFLYKNGYEKIPIIVTFEDFCLYNLYNEEGNDKCL